MPPNWEEARLRAFSYLRAWKLPETLVGELVCTAMSCAEARLRDDHSVDAIRVTIEEAERVLHLRFNEMAADALMDGQELSTEARVAMAWANLPEKLRSEKVASHELNRMCVEGISCARRLRHPERPPQTHPMTMQTSLSRLPSFRMIAGWFVLIALIVLAFIFTR
jgi:hypothetical protein